ncbi:MAG: riboflavin synthase [Oceanicoccus sp.]|jgi:riboflavin synthase
MFTGIIKKLGEIVQTQDTPEGKRLWIATDMDPVHFSLGNSIAVDGVCLTVESFEDGRFQSIAVPETLEKTTLSDLKLNDSVNLEFPLTLQTAIAGHMVSGHVDGIGEVLKAGADYWISVPQELMKYIPVKGSLTINGVSLTVAEVKDTEVRIALIPETLERTNLGTAKQVNLEIDLIARYLERLNQK